MSHFEYIAVAVSLFYSLTLAKLLGALPAAVRGERRYWVHTLWVVNLTIAVVSSWWRLWAFRDVEWSAGSFFALLAFPAIIFLRATVLVSDDPRSIVSWRNHYYEVRMPFFGLQVVGALNFILSPWLISGELEPMQAVVGVALVGLVSVAAALSAVPRFHEVFAVVCFLGFVRLPQVALPA